MYKFIYKRKDDDGEDEDQSDRFIRDAIPPKSIHAQGSMDYSQERNDSVTLNNCSDNGTGNRNGAVNSSFSSDGENEISRKRPAVVLCESPSSSGGDGKNTGETTKIPKLEKVLLQVKTARKSVSNVKIGGPAKPEFTREHSSDENGIGMLRHEARVDVGEVIREENSNNDSTENGNLNDSNEADGEGIAENDNDKDPNIFLSKILSAYNNEFGNNPLSSNDSWDEVTERLRVLGWKYRCLSEKMCKYKHLSTIFKRIFLTINDARM